MGMAMATMQVGMAVNQHLSQKKDAAWTESLRILNNKEAEDELVRQNSNVMDRMEDARSRGIEAMVDNQIASSKSAGAARVISGAAGTGGGSADRVIHDINTLQGNNSNKIVSNHNKELNQLYGQLESNSATYLGRHDSIEKTGPSTVEGLFNVTGAAVQGYSSGQSIQNSWDDYKAGKSDTDSLFNLFGK